MAEYLDPEGNVLPVDPTKPRFYLDDEGNEISPESPADPNYMQRVGARLAAAPGHVARIPGGVKKIARGTGALYAPGEERDIGEALTGAGEVAGGLAALFEPVLAPVGEAGRSLARAHGDALRAMGVYERPEMVMEGLPGIMIPVNPKQMGQAGAFSAEMGAGFTPFGRILKAAGAKIPGPLGKAVTPTGKKMIQELGYEGVRLSQVTKSPLVDFWDNVAGGSMGGAGVYERHLAKTEQRLSALADDFGRAIGPRVADPQVLGHMLHEVAVGNNAAVRAAGRELFRNVDNVHGGPAVDLTEVYNDIVKLSKQFPESDIAGGFLAIARKQTKPNVIAPSEEAVFDAMLRGVAPPAPTTTPKVISFADANDLRSWAFAWKTSGVAPGADNAARVGSQIAHKIEEAIQHAGTRVSPEALDALMTARHFWKKEVHEVFNVRVARQLLKNPNLAKEDIVNTFIKPGALMETQTFKKMLGDDSWRYVQRAFVDDIFRKSVRYDVHTGVEGYDGAALITSLRKWGDTTITEVIGSQQAQRLQDIAEMVMTVQAKEGGGGNMAIKLMQAGPILGSAAGVVPSGAAIPIFVGPVALAKIFTNPKMTKLFIEGLSVPVGSFKARRASAALINFVSDLPQDTKRPGDRATRKIDLEDIFSITKKTGEGGEFLGSPTGRQTPRTSGRGGR